MRIRTAGSLSTTTLDRISMWPVQLTAPITTTVDIPTTTPMELILIPQRQNQNRMGMNTTAMRFICRTT
jgi:hypothetical protein